jgi:hypothetical protein
MSFLFEFSKKLNTPVKGKQFELILKQKKEVLEKLKKEFLIVKFNQNLKCSLSLITKI